MAPAGRSVEPPLPDAFVATDAQIALGELATCPAAPASAARATLRGAALAEGCVFVVDLAADPPVRQVRVARPRHAAA